MGFSTFDYRRVVNTVGSRNNAAGTGAIAISAASSNERGIDTILMSNNDTIDHVAEFSIDTGTFLQIFSVLVPAGSGYGGVAVVELFNKLNIPTFQRINLASGDALQVRLTVAMVGASVFLVQAIGGQY